MLIKIICGTYGYSDEVGTILPKNVKSAPFEVGGKEADRLIRLGVAAKAVATSQQVRPGEDADDTGAGESDSQEEDSLTKLNKPALVKMAKDMGLPSDGGKEELIERIVSEKQRLESETPPALDAALPED